MHWASHSRKVITFKSTLCNIISLQPLLLKQIFLQARFTNTCIYHFQMRSWVMSCTTDPLWLSLSQPVSSEWQLHHPAYICCIAVPLLELTSAAPVIIGRGIRFQDEVGMEMRNALIGREGKISPPLPQRLWFQHANMHDGAFNMYNHMSKLKLCACGCFLWDEIQFKAAVVALCSSK